MADNQTTIEDLNTFVEALRYSQTLVDSTTSQSELSYDFLASFDYYGTVNVAIPNTAVLEAETVRVSGEVESLFFTYSADKLSDFFYRKNELPYGFVNIQPLSDVYSERSLVTTDAVSKLSILTDGALDIETAAYTDDVDLSSPDLDDVLPFKELQNYFGRKGEIVQVDSEEWKVDVFVGSSIIKKPANSPRITASSISFSGGVESPNISFSSVEDFPETLLPTIVGTDKVIDKRAVLPEEIVPFTNIATFSKITTLDFKKFGDEIRLSFSDLKSNADIISYIDANLSTTNGSVLYGGEDIFLTSAQSKMVIDYLVSYIADIETSGLDL